MTRAGSKLLKMLRQILSVFNALLAISATVKTVDLITKISLKFKPKRKSLKQLKANIGPESLSVVSLTFAAGDLAILIITVILGWMVIVTYKRKLIFAYAPFVLMDIVLTILLIIRDASTESWLVSCDINLTINIGILIVIYFMNRELAKNNSCDTHSVELDANDATSGTLNVDRCLETTASTFLDSTLGSSFDQVNDTPTQMTRPSTRRASLWSNGSLICETDLSPADHWAASTSPFNSPLVPFTVTSDHLPWLTRQSDQSSVETPLQRLCQS